MKVICEYCKKEINKKPSDIGNHTFCSLQCMGAWRKNNPEYKKALAERKSKSRKLNEYIDCGEVVTIISSNGLGILIDKEDLEKVKSYTWRIDKNGYAITEFRESINKTKRLQLHRLINNTPENLYTDHINGNKRDNRKINLRSCTARENSINRRTIRKNTTSLIAGVDFQKRDKLWRARISANKKVITLGYFKTESEAIKARIKAEKKFYGEFSTFVDKEKEYLGKIILEDKE